METRKLQLIGGGASYSVSLPKHWVETHGLQAGDEICIASQPDGELRVLANGNRPIARKTRILQIQSRDADEILRTLLAAYTAGFDTAVLEYAADATHAIRTATGEACARLHGVQIVEEAPGRVLLEDLSGTDGLSHEKGLRRMQAIAVQMMANIGRMLEGGKEAIYRENERYEAEIDRLLLFLMKQYTAAAGRAASNPGIGLHPALPLYGMYVARFLERIGDHAMQLAGMVQALNHSMQPELVKPLDEGLHEVVDLLNQCLRAFNTGDTVLANQCIRRALAFSPTGVRESVIDTFTSPRSQPQLPSCVQCLRFSSLLETLERVALLGKSIAEAAIDCAMLREPDAPS